MLLNRKKSLECHNFKEKAGFSLFGKLYAKSLEAINGNYDLPSKNVSSCVIGQVVYLIRNDEGIVKLIFFTSILKAMLVWI